MLDSEWAVASSERLLVELNKLKGEQTRCGSLFGIDEPARRARVGAASPSLRGMASGWEESFLAATERDESEAASFRARKRVAEIAKVKHGRDEKQR